MSVSLSNQVCDNLRIDETSVHTIIIINGYALTLYSIPKVAVWSEKSQQLNLSHKVLFPLMRNFWQI